MNDLIKNWTGESVFINKDPETGAVIYIAIHSTKLGPGVGGSRMKSYASAEEALEDALRLSEGMTYKFAAADVPMGGGKCVIDIPHRPEGDARRKFLLRYGKAINKLGGLFKTGPDSGTSSEDMDVISETAPGNVFGCTAASGDPGPYTALGTLTGIQAVCEQLFGDKSLENVRVLVQGVGDVGRPLIEMLSTAGAEVLFSDINDSVIREYGDERGFQFVPPDEIYNTECDIFSPCALGGVLNADSIPKLKCKAVAGSANNQLREPGDVQRLRDRGILYAPDYIINCGGAVCNTGIELYNWTSEDAKVRIVEKVDKALREIFEISSSQNITTDDAALRMAQARLERS